MDCRRSSTLEMPGHLQQLVVAFDFCAVTGQGPTAPGLLRSVLPGLQGSVVAMELFSGKALHGG